MFDFRLRQPPCQLSPCRRKLTHISTTLQHAPYVFVRIPGSIFLEATLSLWLADSILEGYNGCRWSQKGRDPTEDFVAWLSRVFHRLLQDGFIK
ncbi:MAG: hypothetical protein HW380_12 [Magnetococcales bacterium]|nr:hypothetical protein [Magnetococcales bacterium]